MLSLEYETVPALYDPEVVRGNPPVPSEPASPLTPELATVSFESFLPGDLAGDKQPGGLVHSLE